MEKFLLNFSVTSIVASFQWLSHGFMNLQLFYKAPCGLNFEISCEFTSTAKENIGFKKIFFFKLVINRKVRQFLKELRFEKVLIDGQGSILKNVNKSILIYRKQILIYCNIALIKIIRWIKT